jgi:thiol-disulfide isomerase/thioredoxin
MRLSLVCYLLSFLSLATKAQEKQDAPYQKYPVYPPVKLLMADSSSWFAKTDLPKKRPVMMVLFNPKCEHCQHETEELTQNITRFKGIHIVMATTAAMDEMRAFANKYRLASFENITVGRDTGFFLPVYFDISNLPFHAFYNKKLELISVFAGSLTVEKSLTELGK